MELSKAPAKRIPLHIDVEYKKSYARQSTKGILKNISVSGAFLENQHDLRPQEKLTLTFTVSGRERKIQASVIWRNNLGVGVQFHPTNNRDVQIIDDLMYFVESRRSNTRGILDTIFKKVA